MNQRVNGLVNVNCSKVFVQHLPKDSSTKTDCKQQNSSENGRANEEETSVYQDL